MVTEEPVIIPSPSRPVSDPAASEGAEGADGAAVSTVKVDGGEVGDALPAASVAVDVTW